jgi:3',5'-cyclic AMP phosphodiesterase CpdA
MNRRNFLQLSSFAAAALTFPDASFAETVERPGSFDFIYFTDTHIEPELSAPDGCALCFEKIRSMPADFAIQGGDHVYDALDVSRARAGALYDLYKHSEQALSLKIHHVIGNHDVFGISSKSTVSPHDIGYGKAMYQERMGQTYYSFDHKGYHFIVLDSIQIIDSASWEAGIDPPQLAWLRNDLASISDGMPIVVTIHVPLVTGVLSYVPPRSWKIPLMFVSNAAEVIDLWQDKNVLVVLQGHTHINEVVTFRGIPYASCGAVCGNWWRGARLGTPEGFTVVQLRHGKVEWHYETYGFRSLNAKK